MMDAVSFLPSTRTGKILVYNNYMYTLEKQRDVVQHWRCRDRDCSGRLHYAPTTQVVTLTKGHCHLAEPATVIAAKTRAAILDRASTTVDTPRQIHQHVTGTVPVAATVKLPSYTAVQRAIERKRRKGGIPLAAPETLADIESADHLEMSLRDERFLLNDTGKEDKNRMLVFATDKNIRLLKRSPVWLGDGTFKVTPQLFYQVYTIHGVVDGKAVPLVFALLANKAADTCETLFRILCSALLERGFPMDKPIGPEIFIADFEPAVIVAARRVFPAAKMQGCFFHFGQSVYRKLQSLGLATDYGSKLIFNEHCKMMMALTFVPLEDVIFAWEQFMTMPGLSLGAEFIQYFERTYIGELSGDGVSRKKPLYGPEFWSCAERLESGLQRTTNELEAWHNVFFRTVGCSHQTIYAFYGNLCKEQSHTETVVGKLESGESLPPPKKKYKRVTDSLLKVRREYKREEVLEYLRNIAVNIEVRIS